MAVIKIKMQIINNIKISPNHKNSQKWDIQRKRERVLTERIRAYLSLIKSNQILQQRKKNLTK